MKPWDTLGSRDCLMPTRSLLLVMRPGYVWFSLSAQTFVKQIVAGRCYEFYESTPSCLRIFLPLNSPAFSIVLVHRFFSTDLKHCFCRRGPCTFERFVAIGTSSNEKVPCDGFMKGEDGNKNDWYCACKWKHAKHLWYQIQYCSVLYFDAIIHILFCIH